MDYSPCELVLRRHLKLSNMVSKIMKLKRTFSPIKETEIQFKNDEPKKGIILTGHIKNLTINRQRT